MAEAKELLCEYTELIEKILVQFSTDEKSAIDMLEELKCTMGQKTNVPLEEKELFDACVYNALATINTAPQQKKKNGQLLEALTEAKEELKAIAELL